MIDTETRKEVYKRAVETFGADMQMVVAMEELSELQKEICKCMRGNINLEHMAEEIADVLIMVEQLQQIFMLQNPVSDQMDKKIARLAFRIEAYRMKTAT